MLRLCACACRQPLVCRGLGSQITATLARVVKPQTSCAIPRCPAGAWELNSPGRDIAIPQSGAEIVLTSVDGQRISKRLRSLGSQDLGINFS